MVVLTASQNSKDFFELRTYLCATEPEIGFVCEHEPAERAAGDLLTATMRKIFEKNVKTVCETQRDRCDRGFASGKLGIDFTRNLNIRVAFLEIAAAHIGRIGNRWTDAQCSAPARFDSISAGHKFDFARAEHVVDMEAQLHALLAPFGNSQFLGRRAQDRQLRGRLGAQHDLRVCAGTFNVVRHRHTGLKLVARSGQHRHAWRNDERSANERVAVGRSSGFIGNTDRHHF